jgi:hypothetical protein
MLNLSRQSPFHFSGFGVYQALTAPGLNFNSPPISERWYKKLA